MRKFYNSILLTEGARDRALEQFMPALLKRGIQIDPRSMATVKGGLNDEGNQFPPLSISLLKQYLLNKFVTQGNIHNLSLDSNFYLLGVAKYYFNGDLTTNKQINALYPRIKDRFIPEICQKLDVLILILRNSYIDSIGTQWEQPEDFGTLSIQQLFRKYNGKINKALGIAPVKNQKEKGETEIPKEGKVNKKYTYDIIYTHSEATKYNQATTPGAWCITWPSTTTHYNGYIRKLGIHYVVFRQNGYESIPRVPERDKWLTDEDALPKPQDTYGNSLICLLQRNNSPEPEYITSRWNHGSIEDGTNGLEADHAYTKEEFLNVIGADESILQKIYDEWRIGKEHYKIERSEDSINAAAETRANKLMYMRMFKYMQMMINGGANPFEFKFKDQQGNIEHQVYFKPLGWNAVEVVNSGKPLPTKALYIVSIDDEFSTLMDRKILMIDKIFEQCGRNQFWTEKNDENLMSIELGTSGNKKYAVFDKKRHTLVTVDGVSTFKKISLTRFGNDGEYSKGYFTVALAKRQKALIDVRKMSPVSIRGRVWFEEICNFEHSANDYGNKIKMDSLGSIARMVYDSASGEVYYFNLNNRTLVNIFDGIPEGMHEVTPRVGGTGLGNDFAVFSNRIPNRWSYNYTYNINDGKNTCYMFKNLDTNELVTLNGVSQFRAFQKQYNIIQFAPYDPNHDRHAEDEVLFLYDEILGDFIRDDNNDPIEIDEHVTVGTIINQISSVLMLEGKNDETLYYINGTGKFYCDNINGFVFKYNFWIKGIAFYPGKYRGGFSIKNEISQYLSQEGYYGYEVVVKNDICYSLPPDYEMKEHSRQLPSELNHPLKIVQLFRRKEDGNNELIKNESKNIRLRNIIRETIMNELRHLL